MPWDEWDVYERRAPRPVADGIKARTQRGSFGKTWWAGRWIAALEQLVDAARLRRGRSYARGGQVVSLDVDADGVRAAVQGSRPRPYTVRTQFATLSDEEWQRVIEAMAARAIYAAKLLNGEMPQEIEQVFEAAETNLFPRAAGDLETHCTCPDWANPCKHVAAVHYLLGERFDEDPFLIFVLRGRTKEQIVAALRAHRAGADGAAESAAAPEEEVPPLASDPTAFWTLPESIAALHIPFSAAPLPALPIKQRGEPSFWDGSLAFIPTLEQAYKRIGAHAQEVLLSEHLD
jgi:uncharacterized Zn finger protein